MHEHNEFFAQLLRGEQPPSVSLFSQQHRIPVDTNASIGQVRRVLRGVEDEIFLAVEAIGNILRWHDRDEILAALPEKERAFWLALKAISPPPDLEE
jgi:hypothetical protein